MANLKGKNVLVTGGAGFIGSYLCEKYLREGHRVICIDNLQTNYSTENIDHLMSDYNFTFIKHDIIEPIDFAEPIDWIFNFACPAQCVNLQYDPVHTLKTSVHGVINMLAFARKHKARIMQASTSEIYGHNPKAPQRETDPGEVTTLGPRACYDEGKRVAETLCMDYYRQYAVDVKIIRIFNTYGPRMYVRDGRVMSNFIVAALSGKDLTIYGDGSYSRSFQYVDDLVRGIDKMMNLDNFVGPVNLGNPHEITIKELAELVIKKTGSKSKIVYADLVTDDPVRRQPDISLAREKLGWQPQVSLEQGMDKIIEYFRSVDFPEKKILVFATTYYPDLGPAEHALMDLTQAMLDTEWHIITSRFRKDLPEFERKDNNFIYRIGGGSSWDKFLLPLSGTKKALQLHHQYKFRFVWSIMASYGAISAWFLKRRDKRINFLLSFDRSEITSRGLIKSKILDPILRQIFLKADSVYLSDLSIEKKAKLLAEGKSPIIMRQGKGFVDQVSHTYAELLNKQEKKLARPR